MTPTKAGGFHALGRQAVRRPARRPSGDARRPRPRDRVLDGHECLEPRLLLSATSVDMSEAETLLHYLVNRTRRFPQEWAGRLGIALSSNQTGPFAPVAVNASLLQASRLHSDEMLARRTLSHTGANGSSPGDRAELAGYLTGAVGENVGYDFNYPSYTADAIARRMNDGWFASSGHRANMLTSDWTEFGGAFAVQQPPGGTQYSTELFGRHATGPFLTGVVFVDRNADAQYGAGEGLPGVAVTAAGPAGTFTTTTTAFGGWGLEVPAGQYIVRAAGGGFSGTGTVAITVGAANMAVDFASGLGNGWVDFQLRQNTAPSLSTLTSSLPPVVLGRATSEGAQVSGILGAAFSDPDPLASHGIAVTGTSAGSATGSWHYSINGGATWSTLAGASSNAARLLRSHDLIRFVPATGSGAGSASLSYRAWDQTSGVAGGIANTESSGGTSAFSTAIANATVAVITANTAPVLGSSGGSPLDPVPEDTVAPFGTTVARIVGTSMTDVDPGTPAGIAVTGATGGGKGVWEFSTDDGATWNALGAVTDSAAMLLRSSDRLRFVPVTNFNGTATVTYRAWDQSTGRAGLRIDLAGEGGTGGSAAFSTGTAIAAVSVTAVNDAPTHLVGHSALRLRPVPAGSSFNFEGTTIADLLGNSVADADAGAGVGIALIGLGTGGSWFWNTGGNSWGGGTVSPQFATLLRGEDRVGFQPASGFSGEATVTFRLWDQTTGTPGFNQADLSNPAASTGGRRAFGGEVLTARIFVGQAGTAPTAVLGQVPGGVNSVASIPITFSRSVEGLDVGDFILSRGGVPVSLADASLTGSGTSFVLGNLASVTAAAGSYVLTLSASQSGVMDTAGNRLSANATTGFTIASVAVRPSVDLDGNGVGDMVWVNGDGGAEAWLDGDAGRTRVLGGGGGWSLTATGDFNADGVSDLVWRDGNGGYVAWVMAADGRATTTGFLGGGGGWALEATGDYDGDGRTDLVWRNSSSGANVQWLMNGVSPRSATFIGGTTDWRLVPTDERFDANGDGRTDVVWRHGVSGVNVLVRMNGSAQVSSRVLGGDTAWRIVGSGDFDGDGQSDVLWRGASSGGVVMHVMTDGAVREAGFMGGDLTWSVAGTQVGGGTRRSRIFWRHAAGALVRHEVNGRVVESSVTLRSSAVWRLLGRPGDAVT